MHTKSRGRAGGQAAELEEEEEDDDDDDEEEDDDDDDEEEDDELAGPRFESSSFTRWAISGKERGGIKTFS
jgi:hypothetical protein